MIGSGLDQHAVGGCKSLRNYAGLVAAGGGGDTELDARLAICWRGLRSGTVSLGAVCDVFAWRDTAHCGGHDDLAGGADLLT